MLVLGAGGVACGGDSLVPTAGGDCDEIGARTTDEHGNSLECSSPTGVGRWWAAEEVWDFAVDAVTGEWAACLAKIDITIDVEYVTWSDNGDPLVRLRSGEEFAVLGTGPDSFVGTSAENDAAREAEAEVGAHGSSAREPGTPYYCEG